MSEIKVDTLTGKTTANDITVTVGASVTQSLKNGLIKVWSNFDGNPVTGREALNVSSYTDNSTGDYRVVATNAFSSIDNQAGAVSGTGYNVTSVSPTVSGCTLSSTVNIEVEQVNVNGVGVDRDAVQVLITGDLA